MHVKLGVKLLNYTQQANEMIQESFGISYVSQGFDTRKHKRSVQFASGRIVTLEELGLEKDPAIGEVIPGYTKDDKHVAKIIPSSAEIFVKFLITIGHWKPLETVNATFLVSGISRKTALHFVRYSFLTTNFRSQKYLNQADFEYVLPEEGEEKPEVIRYLKQCYAEHQAQYERLRSMNADPEWARVVLPNGTAQTMSISTNIRQFRHLFDCLCAEEYVSENQRLAMAMFKSLREVLPAFFFDFVTSPDGKRAWREKLDRNVKVNFSLDNAARKEFGLFVENGEKK